MRKLTLEERISRLEKIIKNESADLDNLLFSSRLSDVKRALDDGVNPDGNKPSGFTPLMSAAINDRVAIAKLLIAAGANINATTDDTTALDYAMANGSDRVEAVLIAAGAEMGASNTARSNRGFGPYRGRRNSNGNINYN